MVTVFNAKSNDIIHMREKLVPAENSYRTLEQTPLNICRQKMKKFFFLSDGKN